MNKYWDEVDAELWKNHWDAVDFFSCYCFYSFMPSIIWNSMICYNKVELAVDSVFDSLCSLHELSDIDRPALSEKWELFNSEQLIFIKNWILIIRPHLFERSDFYRKTSMADTVLFDLIDRAKEVEEALKEIQEKRNK